MLLLLHFVLPPRKLEVRTKYKQQAFPRSHNLPSQLLPGILNRDTEFTEHNYPLNLDVFLKSGRKIPLPSRSYSSWTKNRIDTRQIQGENPIEQHLYWEPTQMWTFPRQSGTKKDIRHSELRRRE